MNIFLDDQKNPEWYGLEDVTVCRSAKNLLRLVTQKGAPDILYLDHDLGGKVTGYDVLLKMIEEHKLFPKKVIIISLNPVGVQRILALCDSYKIPSEVHGLENLQIPVIGIRDGDSVI